MSQLQQEELFVKNPDVVESEWIQVQQLVGKGWDGVSKMKEDILGIPKIVIYGRNCYLLGGSSSKSGNSTKAQDSGPSNAIYRSSHSIPNLP